MKKVRNIILTAFLFMMILIPTKSYAKMVDVNVPDFKITFNGVKMDNAYRRYPLITYRDITYLPMTYHDARLLDLETEWSDSERQLTIFKTDGTINYKEDKINTRNRRSYAAITPNFKIMVNGKYIDNNREQYPLLLFRDITYFPLTWRFAIDEFDFYSYNFDSVNGLVINSRKPEDKTKPEKPVEPEKPTKDVTYRAVSLEYRNMNHIVRIEDSKYPYAGNLKVSRDNGKTYQSFGRTDLVFGYKGKELDKKSELELDDYFNVEDGYVIMYGAKPDGTESGLYRIDIMTGKTERMW